MFHLKRTTLTLTILGVSDDYWLYYVQTCLSILRLEQQAQQVLSPLQLQNQQLCLKKKNVLFGFACYWNKDISSLWVHTYSTYLLKSMKFVNQKSEHSRYSYEDVELFISQTLI